MTYDHTLCKSFSYLYEAPHKSCPVTDRLLFGTRLRILEKMRGGFALAETDYGYQGYILLCDLEKATPEGDCESYTVVSPFADILVSPEYKYAPLLTLCRGSTVNVGRDVGCGERFMPVLVHGITAFVRRQDVEKTDILRAFDSAKDKRRQVVKTALSYVGTPYRWAGKGSDGIDCSGLCFMAYNMCGLPLWRDSNFDGRYVFEISPDKLMPCDLVYFKGHIVMYVGDSKYVHSSATLGKVSVNSFDEKSPSFYPKLQLKDALLCGRSKKFKI